MAGSGRARRFRQARELKQNSHEQVCSVCEANLSFGETHDPECEYAQVDPWAEEDDEAAEGEDEEEEW